jgi:hypothetical protein
VRHDCSGVTKTVSFYMILCTRYPGTVGSDEMAPYLSMFNGHVSNSRVFPNSRRFK